MRRLARGAVAAAAVAAIHGIFVHAAPADTWDGGGGTADWSDALNWLDDTAPVSPEALIFTGNTQLSNTNDFAPDTQFDGIDFDAGAGGFTLGGNQVALNGNITDSSAAAQTIDLGLNLLVTPTITVAAGGQLNVNGVMSGVGGIRLTGGGTLSTSAAHTFTGDVFIQEDSNLTVTGTGNIGSAGADVFVGYFEANAPETSSLNLAAGSTASITADRLLIHYNQAALTVSTATGSTVNVNGNNTINANSIIVSAGRNNGNTKGGLGTLKLGAGAVLQLNGASGAGPVTLLDIANYSFETGGATTTGTAGVTDFSAGTVNGTVSTINIATGKPGTTGNTGGTAVGTMLFANGTLNADVINIARVGRQPATGTLTLAAGGTGTLNAGAGGITFGAQGPTGTVATTGTINIDGATLNLGGPIANVRASGAATTGTVNLNGGTLDMNGFAIGAAAPNTIALNLNSGTLREVGEVNGGGVVTKSGSGVLTVAGANTWTGNTDITGGTLAVTGTTASAGNVNVNGGVLGGTGSVGNVSVNTGGTVRAGTAAGDIATLSMSSLFVHNGGGLAVDLGGSFTADLLNVGGNLTLGDDGSSSLSLNVNGSPAVGTYEIIDFAGSLTNPANFNITGPLGFNYALDFATANKVFLDVTAGSPFLTWNGAQDGTTWNLAATNWSNGVSNVAFTNGIDVLFNDTAPGGATTINVAAAVSPGEVLVSSSSNNYTFTGSSPITGAASLTKSGGSTLTVLNNNNYSGVTTINAGTVQVGNGGTSGALGSGNIVNQSSLVYNRSDSFVVANNISGAGALTAAGTGTLVLTGANSYGSTTINAGSTVSVGNGGTSGTLGAGPVSNSGTLIFNRSDDLTVANVISGAGALRKTGAGTTTLSGASSYTGTTTITGGMLAVTSLPNAGTNSPIGTGPNAASLEIDGGTLRWAGGADQTSNRNFTLGASGGTLDSSPTAAASALVLNGTAAIAFFGTGPRTLALAGTDLNTLVIDTQQLALAITDQDATTGQTSVVKNGNNRWQLNNGGNTYSGGTTINAGGIRINNVAAFGAGPVGVANGAQAYINAAGTVPNNFSIAGVGPAEQPGVEVIGNFGALRVANVGAVLSGTITLTADARITGRSGGTGGNIAGQITGPHALEFGNTGGGAGALVISNAANNWTGDTTVGHGTLKGGAANVIPSGAGKGNVIVSNTSTANDSVLDLNGFDQTVNGLSSAGLDMTRVKVQSGAGPAVLTVGNNDASATYAGIVQDGAGPLGLAKTGAGMESLTGTNTYSGGTTVNAGTLQVNRLHENNGVNITGGTLRVAESAPGLSSGFPSGDNAFVSRPSSLTIAAGATLDITNNDVILDYSGASPIATFEALVASGYVVGVGDWSGTGITSSVAQADGNYVVAIADNAALAAPFGTANGGPLFSGVDVDIDTILIKFTHRADVDLDGVITPNDAAIFGGNYSENDPAVWSTGDMDYDGIYTPNDAAIFGGFYDESLASLPEPGSLAAIGLLGVGMARRRRRK